MSKRKKKKKKGQKRGGSDLTLSRKSKKQTKKALRRIRAKYGDRLPDPWMILGGFALAQALTRALLRGPGLEELEHDSLEELEDETQH